MTEQAPNQALLLLKKQHQKNMMMFTLSAVLLWVVQFAWQIFTTQDTWQILLNRSFSFTAATLIIGSLFSSIVFKFRPALAKHWRIRRYLGVSGVVFMVMHVAAVLAWYYNFRVADVFYSLNPFQNAVLFGVIAEPILLLLAFTSTDWAMQKIGPKRWKNVHRLVYLAFYATIFHFIQINPAALLSVPGFFLLALTAATLLGELYWFIKIAGKVKFRSGGAVVGFGLMGIFLTLTFLWWRTHYGS